MFILGEKLSRENSIPGQRQKGARFALLVLSGINLLNFADRYVPSGVKELIKDDLHLTDAETSLPTTGMIVVYMIFAVVFGWLGDKNLVDRRVILAAGIAFWSLATAAAGLAQNLEQLIILRSLVGVGEAAYSTVAPPLISDFFPHRDRNVAFGIYYLAIPIGSALGFGIGSVVGAAFSWRIAFFVVGIPGIIVAVIVLKCCDPIRGINDSEEFNKSKHDTKNDLEKPLSDNTPIFLSSSSSTQINHSFSWTTFYHELVEIMSNPYYSLSLAGLVANNFALGGLADWFPSFFNRYDNVSVGFAGLIIGAATVIGGIGGNLIGSKAVLYFDDKIKNSYFLIPALFTLPGAACLFIVINITGNAIIPTIFATLGQLCIWTNLAPISALSITCIPPRLRARSCGIMIFMQHILGDMISPPIIGVISDKTGSLKTALQITWIAVIVSGTFWFAGYYFLPQFEAEETSNNKYDNNKESSYYEMIFGSSCGGEGKDEDDHNGDSKTSEKKSLRTSDLARNEDIAEDIAILETK